MKTYKKLLATLLAIAMICVLTACVQPETPAGNTATVTYYNGEEVYETATVEIGSKLTLPEDPDGEKGKGLVGWSTIDGDVEEIIDPATYVVEANVNLYAVWADVYTVVINADNGTPFTVKEVFAGTVIEQPADPVKEGFKFVEWRDALAETTYDWTKPIQADITIKAMYGDGSPNRVSDTKWDFTLGHGAWIGGQGGWGRVENGINATDMVYTTTEDGYAAWGFTLTDSLENIPEINGENDKGFGMKFLYNEGISVEASKAKLVVVYVKPKYYPIDIYGDLNDQFRISILTSNGGMIYGYGTGSEDWTVRSDGGSKSLVQADIMEDGWIRVQFKIHELKVWSEDAILKSMSLAFVQRPSTPVMDIISVKSIELLDQEEFIDPHVIDYVTNNQWDMTKEEESADWFGVMQTGSNTTSVTTTIDANGTQYVYGHTNAWRAMVMNLAKIDVSKCSGTLAVTMDTKGMSITQYRIYIVTDKGGDLYKNSGRDDVACYYTATSPTELVDGWTIVPNADGTITVYYDLTKLEYWNGATELQGLSFVTVDATTNGTVVYKTVSLVDTVKEHNCETDGHKWVDATCTTAKTCSVCGATEGEAGGGHAWADATCTAPKTCTICGETEGEANGHTFVDATCTSRVTCSTCGTKKGERLDHNYVDGVCSGCGLEQVTEFTQNKWDMTKEADASQWYCAQAYKEVKPSLVYSEMTEAGFKANYGHKNAWKGIILKDVQIDIAKLSGLLSFTYYTEDLDITNYRIHVLTDKGGDLLSNTSGTPSDYYVAVAIADIAGSDVWTRTENADGSVTVTFDLTTLPFFADGTVLMGMDIVTVANSTTGEWRSITYKSIELEEKVTHDWDMTKEADASQWYNAQAYTAVKPEVTTSEITDAGFKVNYLHKNGWKGIILKDVSLDITKLSGLLSFTYIEEMDITNYRVHVLTDKGGSLTDNTTGTPSDYYIAIPVADIAGSEAWTRTVNADGSITVTFDLTTLPFFADGTVLMGMDIVTVTATGTTGTVTYKSIAIN